MPISFTPISKNGEWSGDAWSVADEDKLAEMIARVALGQYRQVLRILKETNFSAYAPAESALEGAVKLLTVVSAEYPYHRDGWMFQVIAWIAANMRANGALIAPPHMIHAHKGFDCIHVELNPDTREVQFVVVCEEKATENAGSTMGKIWPSLREMEGGKRVNELSAEVSTLLDRRSDIDVDAAIKKIIWEQARAFRVSITIDDNDDTDAAREKLFGGYVQVVAGADARRRANTFHQTDIRAWMNQLATKAIAAATRIEEAADV